MRGKHQIRGGLAAALAGVIAGCGLAPLPVRRANPGAPPEARLGLQVAAHRDGELALGVDGLHSLQEHPAVTERVAQMLGRGRVTLQTALERSVDFVPMIEEQLALREVPAELAYLPMVESRFRPNAVGRTAVGLWQFTRSTARRYGLRVDRSVDERRDPAKSSRAAARYLRDLYDQFECWDLALAAYNAGPGRVRRALEHRPEAGFFELADRELLPRVTRGYVPKVLAISLIGPQAADFGVELDSSQTRAAARSADRATRS